MPATKTDTRSISQILFSRRREVENFPALRGCQEFTYVARRNRKGRGYLSAMLCKAVVVALQGDVTGITALAEGGVTVRSRSQSGAGFHTCYLVGERAWLPRGNVTYHLGLLMLAEALAEKERAVDLLDAWEELLDYRDSLGGSVDERYKEVLMHVCDELYFWAKYKDGDPDRDPERLDSALQVLDAAEPPTVTPEGPIGATVFTDLGALRVYRRGETVDPAEPVEAMPRARFRGWQLPELIEFLDIGLHCLLVGPTATGKSLCAFEAFERAKGKKPVFVIEGHESLKEFDLLGCYTPDGKGGFIWRDGLLVQAMRAGGYLFVDEANRMTTRTINVLLGVISRGAVVLTEHGSEEVKAEEGFQVVMAMNLGKGYAVNTLDTALLNRFGSVLEFRYLPPREEEELLVAETGIDRELARTMVKVANETRRLKRNKELSGEITPRGLFAWARKFLAKKAGDPLTRLKAAAKVTWMHQVAGTDADGYLREEVMNMLLDLIEAHTPR